MPLYVPPPDFNDGQILHGADLNAMKNGLASYLNNGGIGDSEVSANPAEKIKQTKIDYSVGGHHTTHEPGGTDQVRDIKFSNGAAENASLHAARHAAGGVDPLTAASISAAMLQSGSISDTAVTGRKDTDPTLAWLLGVTLGTRNGEVYVLSSTTGQPVGRGVARKNPAGTPCIYFACKNTDQILQLDPATGTQTYIAMVSGDHPKQLLGGTGPNIYILCGGGAGGQQAIKMLDANNNLTTITNLRTDGSFVSDLIDVDYLVPNSASSHVFVLGSRTGDAAGNYRVLMRVSLTATVGITHKVDLGTTNTPIFTGLCLGRNVLNGATLTENVATLYHDTLPTNQIRTYKSADLTVVGSLAAAGGVVPGQPLIWDGQYASQATSGATGIMFQYEILNYANPFLVRSNTFASPPSITGAGIGFFDGKNVMVADSGATRPQIGLCRAPEYFTNVLKVDDAGVTTVATGFATDGQNVYICASNAAVSDARVIRLIL